MGIDWVFVSAIAGPIIGAVIGAAVARAIERRPRLVTYYGHVSAFSANAPNGRVDVYTHNIVVRNNGGRSAKNVRLGHNHLPDFNVFPRVQYEIVDTADGAREIVFPSLVPGEQVTVSYLYGPPITYGQINTFVKSNEGMAKVLTVLLQRQYPQWFNITVAILLLIGLVTVVYLAIQLIFVLIPNSQ